MCLIRVNAAVLCLLLGTHAAMAGPVENTKAAAGKQSPAKPAQQVPANVSTGQAPTPASSPETASKATAANSSEKASADAPKTMEPDIERPGGDYKNFAPAQASAGLCQSACEGDAQCKAWTYLKPADHRGGTGQCSLKSSVPSAKHNKLAISGVPAKHSAAGANGPRPELVGTWELILPGGPDFAYHLHITWNEQERQYEGHLVKEVQFTKLRGFSGGELIWKAKVSSGRITEEIKGYLGNTNHSLGVRWPSYTVNMTSHDQFEVARGPQLWRYGRVGEFGREGSGLLTISRTDEPTQQDQNSPLGQVSDTNDSLREGMEIDTDRHSMDYRGFELREPNPARCQAACMDEAQCKAWTYVKPGIQGPNARCWLKNGVPNPTQNTCCVSGLKLGPEQRVEQPAAPGLFGQLQGGVNSLKGLIGGGVSRITARNDAPGQVSGGAPSASEGPGVGTVGPGAAMAPESPAVPNQPMPVEAAESGARANLAYGSVTVSPKADIVGLRLGMTADEIRLELRNHSKEMRITEERGTLTDLPGVSFVRRVLGSLERGGPNGPMDAIGVHFPPPPSKPVAIFIDRWTGFEEGKQPLFSSMRDGLVKKYGTPSLVRESGPKTYMTWAFRPSGDQIVGSTVESTCPRINPIAPQSTENVFFYDAIKADDCGLTIYAELSRNAVGRASWGPLATYLTIYMIDASAFANMRAATRSYVDQGMRDSASKVKAPDL